ncbi:uncharacterized protein LOC118927735 isoform X2 [Manis pentadactyla]|uniref:uncharacterized protein LOC118927735 isoform X2 n=1 Tax=Manis pentadactyla TaxID=143292 RepID=UPI00255C3E9C|nr:uncharacterized protein LOC118927735 isoform X2 [Manis pentadactyla]
MQGIDHSRARARKEKLGIPDLATGANYTQPQTGGPRGQRGAAIAREPWGTRGAPEPWQPSGFGGGARKRRSCCLARRRRQTASWEKCMPGSFFDLISRLLPVLLPNLHGGGGEASCKATDAALGRGSLRGQDFLSLWSQSRATNGPKGKAWLQRVRLQNRHRLQSQDILLKTEACIPKTGFLQGLSVFQAYHMKELI